MCCSDCQELLQTHLQVIDTHEQPRRCVVLPSGLKPQRVLAGLELDGAQGAFVVSDAVGMVTVELSELLAVEHHSQVPVVTRLGVPERKLVGALLTSTALTR